MDNSIFQSYYSKLLSSPYKFKSENRKLPTWAWISEKKLTVCPHFVGNLYPESSLRLMVVGRAVNGWDVDAESCTSLEAALNMVFRQEDRFEDVAKDKIVYIDSQTGKEKSYRYSNSRFWKLIRHILEQSGESENYHQRILWSNLYKVAPYTTGNPSWGLIKPQMQIYIDLLVKEIRLYKPSHILFITGMDYLNPWPNEPQFGETLGIGTRNQTKFFDSKFEVGEFEGSKIVVCERPENKSDEAIAQMARDILKLFA
ncbi:MAG: hypothetical protein E7223_01420 [Clostridiales bacterium]|nr:hypothetical protein [Clostridiales bacterium]